jgi:hypothetical protein
VPESASHEFAIQPHIQNACAPEKKYLELVVGQIWLAAYDAGDAVQTGGLHVIDESVSNTTFRYSSYRLQSRPS